MDDQLVKYESYAFMIKRTLLLTGLWPGNVTWKLYPYVRIFYVLVSLMASSAIINFVVHNTNNLSLAMRGLSLAFSMFTSIQKVAVFTIYRQLLMEVHEILDKSFTEDLKNREHRPVLLSALGYFKRPTVMVSLATYLIIPIYFVAPPISIIIQWAHRVKPIKYHLPFPSQYPWTIGDNGGIYSIHYFLELLAGIAVAATTSAVDSLFGFYIFQITGQFRVLSYRMSNLKATDDYPTAIKECIRRHQILMQCRDIVERLYGPIILWMAMTSAIVICALIFQTSNMSINKAVIYGIYICMKLTQTLLYGWYGQFLTTETEAFRDSIYSSGWPGSGEKSFMSTVLIMIQCKPLVLTACHLSTISLDMFLAIMNTAVSYFFLLQTLDEKK